MLSSERFANMNPFLHPWDNPTAPTWGWFTDSPVLRGVSKRLQRCCCGFFHQAKIDWKETQPRLNDSLVGEHSKIGIYLDWGNIIITLIITIIIIAVSFFFYYCTGSTVNTNRYMIRSTLKIARFFQTLGDSGFLQFFRVVSSDDKANPVVLWII